MLTITQLKVLKELTDKKISSLNRFIEEFSKNDNRMDLTACSILESSENQILLFQNIHDELGNEIKARKLLANYLYGPLS